MVGGRSRGRNAVSALLSAKRDRQLAVILLVAFALRLAWALWATRTPVDFWSDTAQYQVMAMDFADRKLPSMAGEPSAFWPPGYPLLLAPVAWIAGKTGLLGLPLAASLLNVVLGTLTVLIVGMLAELMCGRQARNIAAGLMAVGPGHIYFTSTTMSETAFTCCFLGALLAIAYGVEAERSNRWFLVVGLLVGWCALMRTPGALLVVVPLLCARWLGRDARRMLRPTMALLAGMLILLVPWSVRNGVQVGISTPVSANNAAFVCLGNADGATGAWETTASLEERCFGGSGFGEWGEAPVAGDDGPGPNQAEWYRTTVSDTIDWIAANPGEQPGLVARRLYETFKGDHDGLLAASDFGSQAPASERWMNVLQIAASMWHWGVIALAAVGLMFVRQCRQATPIWGLAALQVPLILTGVGVGRYHHPILPLLVVLAAGALVAIRRGAETIAPVEVDVVVGAGDR